MKGIELERRALAIDALLAILYVATWILAVLYAFTHTLWL
jgi:hypothetical protein